MAVNRMGVGILAQPVAFMAAQGLPFYLAVLPVNILDGDVGPVLFMGIRAVVRAVVENSLGLSREFEIAVTDQMAKMIHGKMAVGIIVFRQGDLSVVKSLHIYLANKCQPLVISAVIDDSLSVVLPHLMTDPVMTAALMPIVLHALGADPQNLVFLVVIEPDAADAAVKAGPFMIVKNLLLVGRVKLYVGDPAVRNGLFVEKTAGGSIIYAEIAA